MLRSEAGVKVRARRIWLPGRRSGDAQHVTVCPNTTQQGSHLGHLCRQLGWAGSKRGNAVQKLDVAALTGPLVKPFSLRLPTQEVWG